MFFLPEQIEKKNLDPEKKWKEKKKKDAPGRLYKSTTENRPFLTETEFLL